MAEERVVLTAELKDQMSAPLDRAEKKVEGFTRAVETGTKKQAAAVDKSTAQIDGALGKQNRLFSGMSSVIGRTTDAGARMFSGMRTKIKSALDGLPEYTKQQGERAGSGFANGLKAAAGLVATYFGAQMVGGFIAEAGRASDATDKFKSTMSFAGLDTSAITQATADAKAFADQTVYDLPTIQKTMATLAANGVKDYSAITKAAGNLNAVAGGNAETFKSVSLALGQSAGAGKLMAEDWNMLADAIPGASGQLQNAMREAGAFEGNFKKAMESGEISAEEFQAAILTLGNQPIAVEAAKSTKTFEGALGNLTATINSGLMRGLDKIKPAATAAIGVLTDGLAKGIDWVSDAAQGLYDLLVKGDYQGALRRAFGWEEDSKAVDMLFALRDAAIELPDKLAPIATGLWDMREPIGIIAGLILALLIPHWMRLGTEALISAGKQRAAWAIAQGAAMKATYVQLWGLGVTIAGWVIAGTQAMIQGARIAAGWLLAMGPVGWIIGIIALLIGAFVWAYNNIGWFKDGVDAAMKWVGEAVHNVGQWITAVWTGVVDWWNTNLMPGIQAIGQWFTDVFNGVIGWWNGTLLPAISAVGQWFSDLFTNVGNWARDFVGFFVDGWGMLVDFWNGVFLPALQAVADFFAPIFDWIVRLIWNATTIAMFLFLKLVDFWNGVLLPALQAVGQWFSDIFTWIYESVIKPVVDSIVLGFQGLVDFFSTVFAWVYNTIIKPYVDLWVAAFRMVVDWWNFTFLPALQAIGQWFSDIFAWIYNTIILPYITFWIDAFRMVVDWWNNTLIPALQAVGQWFGDVLNWIYNTIIKPVVDLIIAGFNGLVDWWNGTLSPMITTVGGWFRDGIGGAIDGVKGFIDGLIKGFEGFITFWTNTLKPVADKIAEIFRGIGDAVGDALGKIGEFANNPLGGIQDMLGIAKDDNGQGIMPSNSGGGVYRGNGVAFAGGGVLGGYAPGHDSILARLSPGESVLVPELTRAIGPQNIMAANASASGGRPAGSGPALTSGFDSSSGRGGGTTTIVQAPIQITVIPNGDGSVDMDELERAIEEIFERVERRRY